MTFAAVLKSKSPTMIELEIAALIATRDRLWSQVTGHHYSGPDAGATLHLHGISPADVSRIAKINGKIAACRRVLR